MAQQSNINISIPKEAVGAMPQVEFNGHITVVDTAEKAREALAFLRRHTLLGFDTETRPNFRKGQNHQVALIQISTLQQSFLFRICRTGFLEEICELLEDAGITKIGLSLKDDFHMLHKLRPFEPRGFVELQDMVHDYCITDASLQKIYGIIFGRRISKGQRLTNWEAPALTEAQKNYAAIDAWACLRIYRHLISGHFVPEQSEYAQPACLPSTDKAS